MPTLLRQNNYKIMPWKNGLGTTAEIAIQPPHAVFPTSDFDFRISSATVHSVCTFSQFPGYDRILCVWRGTGMRINGQIHLANEPFHFQGEEIIQCQPDGPIVDIGVIYRREKFTARMMYLPHLVDLQLDKGENYLFAMASGDTYKLTPTDLPASIPEGSYLLIHIAPVS